LPGIAHRTHNGSQGAAAHFLLAAEEHSLLNRLVRSGFREGME
jgi:hypothetical protein